MVLTDTCRTIAISYSPSDLEGIKRCLDLAIETWAVLTKRASDLDVGSAQ